MERMLARVGESGEHPHDATEAIRSKRLGTNADKWIVTIAKMNMYIHGDGKTNIRHEDGLFLADSEAVPTTGTLLNNVDVVLTNPPLGGLDYQAVGPRQCSSAGS